MIDMVWRYKYYTNLIENYDNILNSVNDNEALVFYSNKRKAAFQQLLDFQVAFHSKD